MQDAPRRGEQGYGATTRPAIVAHLVLPFGPLLGENLKYYLSIEMPETRSRGWSVTINNYTDEDIAQFVTFDEVDYRIVGFEVGKEGTPHLQGYVYNRSKISFEKIKEQFPRAHIEAEKASFINNILYCMKDNDYIEYGERPRQGARSDLDVIRHDLIKGVPEKKIAEKYFPQWCQYRRAFREYVELNANYDTLLVLYNPMDPNSCKKLKQYMKNSVYKSTFDYDLWPVYYSNQYQHILCPRTDGLVHTIEACALDGNQINYIEL